jgi:ribosome biogenesis GTPase A
MAHPRQKSPKKSLGPVGILDRVLRDADVVLYIVDARFPKVSKRVAEFCKRSGKIFLVILNKIDLVAGRPVDVDYPTVPFTCKKPGKYKKLLLGRIYSTTYRRLDEQIKVAVIGYPNVGKSSVINALSHRKSMSVSSQAGHTQSVQWLRMGRILLSDTPGVITERAPKKELVLTGSLNIEREADPEGICEELIDKIFSAGRAKVIFEHFDIAPCGKHSVIEAVARRRGRIGRGGEPNLTEAARIIVSEWQRGKITI